MAYSNAIYEKALNEIKTKAKVQNAEYNLLLSRLYEDIPRLSAIDSELGKIGSKAAITALSGDMQLLKQIQQLSQALSEEKQEIIKSAGIIKPEPDCKICNDTGFMNGKYCSCVHNLAKKISFQELSRLMPLGDCKFENFDLKYYSDKPDQNGVIPRKIMTGILKLAKEYALTFGKNSDNLLFTGGVGLGKTHISLSIVSSVTEQGYDVIYGSAQNLFSAAEREHFSYSGSSEKLDALLNCDLLVIDDLGTEFLSSFTQSLFYNIVNTRLLEGLPTIINTNLSFRELEERYTPRITSRFIGEYKLIKFFGNDIRQQKMLAK